VTAATNPPSQRDVLQRSMGRSSHEPRGYHSYFTNCTATVRSDFEKNTVIFAGQTGTVSLKPERCPTSLVVILMNVRCGLGVVMTFGRLRNFNEGPQIGEQVLTSQHVQH